MASSAQRRARSIKAKAGTETAHKVPDPESPLARRNACVTALQAGGADRALQAYNELMSKAKDTLDEAWKSHRNKPKELRSALQRLCHTHRVS